MEIINKLKGQIKELFTQNKMQNSAIYDLFEECLNNEIAEIKGELCGEKSLKYFYIDEKIEFKGRRRLEDLLFELEIALLNKKESVKST